MKWYVYLLCDPDTKEPFYVGKGTGNRMHQHEKMLNAESDHNQAKKQAIRQIIARGKQVLKIKVAEFDNEKDAYAHERSLIQQLKHQLTNITTRDWWSEETNGLPIFAQQNFYSLKQASYVSKLSPAALNEMIWSERLNGSSFWPYFAKRDIDVLAQCAKEDPTFPERVEVLLIDD